MSAELLTVHDVAKRLRVKPNTVLVAIRRGRLPTVERNPYRIHPDAVERYDRERRKSRRHGHGGSMKTMQPRRKLSDDQIHELRARYATGKATQQELAAAYNVSPATVSKYCRGIGASNQLTPEQIAEIQRRYGDGNNGVTQSELATEYKVSQPTISHVLRSGQPRPEPDAPG